MLINLLLHSISKPNFPLSVQRIIALVCDQHLEPWMCSVNMKQIKEVFGNRKLYMGNFGSTMISDVVPPFGKR